MISKTRKKILDELKQLKVRQKCIEKGTCPSVTAKMEELDEDEKKFCNSLDKLKIDYEKNQTIVTTEAKALAKEVLQKIHKFKRTIIEGDDTMMTTRSSDILDIIADINSIISENVFICDKEMSSLKFQLDKM